MKDKKLKDIVKEYEKQIEIFNNKYKHNYLITCFLDIGDNKCLDLYLHFLKKGKYFYTFKILIDDLFKYEPKYIIYRLIENSFIKEDS